MKKGEAEGYVSYYGYRKNLTVMRYVFPLNLIAETTSSTLSPASSQKIRNYSPNGFSWGYDGSGPAQLALALLLDATGDKEVAVQYYQQFKTEVVAWFPDDWTLSQDEIKEWVNAVDKGAFSATLIRRMK